MFKRWMILLAALFGLSALGTYNLILREEGLWEASGHCRDYLATLPDTWTASGDKYWFDTCESENPISSYSLAISQIEYLNGIISFGIYVSMAIIGLMLASIVGRWVVKGRPW